MRKLQQWRRMGRWTGHVKLGRGRIFLYYFCCCWIAPGCLSFHQWLPLMCACPIPCVGTGGTVQFICQKDIATCELTSQTPNESTILIETLWLPNSICSHPFWTLYSFSSLLNPSKLRFTAVHAIKQSVSSYIFSCPISLLPFSSLKSYYLYYIWLLNRVSCASVQYRSKSTEHHIKFFIVIMSAMFSRDNSSRASLRNKVQFFSLCSVSFVHWSTDG